MKNPLRFLQSMKFGMILLGLVLICSIIGSLIRQGNELTFYEQVYPSWSKILLLMQFHKIFSSWYFITLLALLCLNLISCSLIRLRKIADMPQPALLAAQKEKSKAISPEARASVRYLKVAKRNTSGNEEQLKEIDYHAYRLVAFGFLMLTVVILSGCIWAEQAWSAFWSWDPKETWALTTWIIYAIYLHQRLRKKWQRKSMAYFAPIGVICILFTFIGVNQLLPGLHSYS